MLLSREFFSSKHCLFKYHDSGVYGINPRSTINEEAQNYFTFFGMLMAKAIFDKRLVDVNLCTMLFRHLLGTKYRIDFCRVSMLCLRKHCSFVFVIDFLSSLLKARVLFSRTSESLTRPCFRVCNGF
jgi:hypothetical protein